VATALSEREQIERRWQNAARDLLKAAEERSWIFFARAAIYKAIHRPADEMPPIPGVKKAERWRERRRTRGAGLSIKVQRNEG